MMLTRYGQKRLSPDVIDVSANDDIKESKRPRSLSDDDDDTFVDKFFDVDVTALTPTTNAFERLMHAPHTTTTVMPAESFVDGAGIFPQTDIHGPTVGDHSAERRRQPTRSYRDGRTAKLLEQKPNAALYPSVNDETPLIFSACTMWLDGETDDGSGQFTAFHLGNLIRLHGGNVLFFFSRTQLTHIICNHLTLSKHTTEWTRTFHPSRQRRSRGIPVVPAKWVIDSIQEKRRLDVGEYTIIKHSAQNDIRTSLMRTRSAPTHGIPSLTSTTASTLSTSSALLNEVIE